RGRHAGWAHLQPARPRPGQRRDRHASERPGARGARGRPAPHQARAHPPSAERRRPIARHAARRRLTDAARRLVRLKRLPAAARAALALPLGAVAALALPPLDLVPALLAFSGLMLLLRHPGSPRGAFVTAWAFGLGWFGAGLYWIAIAFYADADRFG